MRSNFTAAKSMCFLRQKHKLLWCSDTMSSHTKRIKKIVVTASFPGAQPERGSMEKRAASLLVAPLGRALNGMPSSLCGRQVVGPSSLPVMVAQPG